LLESTKDVKSALVSSHLGTKYLTTSGFLCFTGNESNFIEKKTEAMGKTSLAQTIADSQLAHLNVILGEREDLEKDVFITKLLFTKDILYAPPSF
jgi:hypothetical protein